MAGHQQQQQSGKVKAAGSTWLHYGMQITVLLLLYLRTYMVVHLSSSLTHLSLRRKDTVMV